jgi:hypothetical protein
MDKPVSPAEQLGDALTSLVAALQSLADALEILACEMIVADGSRPPRA